MPTATPINTTQLFNRRTLHFNSIDEILTEADRLAAFQQAGKLRSIGNWSSGQNLGHLASWIDFSYDGVPFKVPFIARIIMRPMKKRTLYKPMKPGSRIPKLKDGTVGIDPLGFDEGLTKFRKNFSRLKSECPKIPHALFGRMTHEEWIAQHLRHAELHLSFLRAD
jgi:hypothetical protein